MILTSTTTNVTITGLIGGLQYWFALVVVGGRNEGTSNIVTAVPLESTPTPTVEPTVTAAPTVTGAPSVSPTAGPSVTVTSAPSVSPTGGGAAGSGGGGGCSVGDASLMAGVVLLLPLLLAGLKSRTR